MIKIIRTLVKACFIIAVLAFIFSFTSGNKEIVTFTLPPMAWALTMPLYMLLGVFFIIGALLAVVNCSMFYAMKCRRLKKEKRLVEKEHKAVAQQLKAELAEKDAKAQMQEHIVQIEQKA